MSIGFDLLCTICAAPYLTLVGPFFALGMFVGYKLGTRKVKR